MKNADGVASPAELERRLKRSLDHLRDVRETMEELGRNAGTLHRLFKSEQTQEHAKAAPPSRPTEKAPSPARAAPPSSAPSAPPAQDEIPEWRKLFPKLSAEVPGRK